MTALEPDRFPEDMIPQELAIQNWVNEQKHLNQFIYKSESELFLQPGFGHNDLTLGKACSR